MHGYEVRPHLWNNYWACLILAVAALPCLIWSVEEADFLLLQDYSSGKFHCAVKGAASDSAITWIADVSSWEWRESMSNLTTKPDDPPYAVTGDGWMSLPRFSDRERPFLDDYRWESLRLHVTYNDVFQVTDEIPTGTWRIDLSVRTQQDAHILLCSNVARTWSEEECYLIILGGWYKQGQRYKSVLRRCAPGEINTEVGPGKYPRGSCQVPLMKSKDPMIGSDHWFHFTIKWNDPDKVLSLTRKGEVIPFFAVQMDNPVDVKRFLIRSQYAYGLWKVHDYTYLYPKKAGESLRVDLGYVKRGRNCLAIQYFIKEKEEMGVQILIGKDYTKIGFETYELEDDGEWHEIHLKYYLESEVRVYVYIFARTVGIGIGNIRSCDPRGEVRISSWDSGPASCHLLKYNRTLKPQAALNPTSYGKDCDNGRFMFNCSEDCSTLRIPDACDGGHAMCVPREGSQACYCVPGFQGPNCYTKCKDGVYGFGCHRKCGNCLYGVTCHHVTGVCTGGCRSGYVTEYCNTTLPVLLEAPKLQRRGTRYMAFSVDPSNYSGKGNASAVQLQYKVCDSGTGWYLGEMIVPIREGTSLNINLNNLKPDTCYNVRGVLILADGDYYGLEAIPDTTQYTDCKEPAFGVTAGKTNVTVKPEFTGEECSINRYQYYVSGGGTPRYVNFSNFTQTIEGLHPYTEYTLQIKKDGEVVYSTTFTTEQGAPSEVRSLSADSNATTISVQWKEPQFKNGIIKHYGVSYQHVGYRACMYRTAEPAAPMKTRTNTGNETSIILSNLIPYSQYVVTVWAFTEEKGNESSFIQSTLGEDTPSETPALYIKGESSTSVSITVKDPEDCTTIRGANNKIQVYVTGLDEWNKMTDTNPTYFEGKEIYLKNLIPFSNYSLKVRFVRHDKTNSTAVLDVDVTTKASGPPAVSNLTAYAHGPGWVSLRWKPPYPPQGVLKKYRIKRWSQTTSKTYKNSECALWKGYICAKIDSLSHHTAYNFVVTGINIDPDSNGRPGSKELEGLPAGVQATTTEKPSSEPENLNATVHNDQVTIQWEYPWLPAGNIEKFEGKIEMKSSKLLYLDSDFPTTFEVNATEQQLTYRKELHDLPPSTNYSVRVQAKSSVYGKEGIVPLFVPTTHPRFTDGVTVEREGISEHTVTIKLPIAPRFLTTNSASFVVVTLMEGKAPSFTDEFLYYDLHKSIITKVSRGGKASWIAAELQLEQTSQLFVVGQFNQSSVKLTTKHCRKCNNHPLESASKYQIYVVAVNFEESNVLAGYSSLSQPVVTGGIASEYHAPLGLLALLLLLVIPILLYVAYKRYYQRKSQPKEMDDIPLHRPVSNKGLMKHWKKMDMLGVKVKPPVPLPPVKLKNDEENEIGPVSEDIPVPTTQPLTQQLSSRVNIGSLEQYVRTALVSGELQRQHALFPRKPTQPCDYGRLPENKPKNRYANLVAYDATRVILKKLPNDEFSDYINANYVDGYKSSKFYIATQGPKPNTLVDFWRMVWQEEVQIISMLTNVVENGKTKCEKYWPDLGKEETYGTVTILTTSQQIFADYTFRRLQITHKGKKRTVHHLHFTSWPDHGVPMYPQSVATYVKKLLATQKGTGPILVHCSAGVGRTGTIILADINLRMAAAEGAVDVLSYQQRIREQRSNLVDNLDQYKLVHFILLECLVEEASEIPCEGDFQSRVRELRNNGGTDRQFHRLRKYNCGEQPMFPERNEHSKPPQNDPHKNRFANIVPGSFGQIFLSQASADDPSSTYINAVSVDGFRAKNQFIATQFPVAETVGDFWRMVLEKKISLIIILNEIDVCDKTVVEFLPTEDNVLHPVPYIKVRHNKMNEYEKWNLYFLQITDESLEGQLKQESVRVLHFKGWHTKESLPPSANSLLSLWKETESVYMGKGPILVTCLDGAKACGLFLALAFLVEKVKLEQVCDACQAVRIVCQSRNQFIASQDQFEFLYDAVTTYLEGFQIYANFQ